MAKQLHWLFMESEWDWQGQSYAQESLEKDKENDNKEGSFLLTVRVH